MADTKDWTWVLDRPCPECGLDLRTLPREELLPRLRDTVTAWEQALGGPEPGLRARPAPEVWSPLEYGCHVRDVYALFDERLRLMLTQDHPSYPNWDQDSTAESQRYDEQSPAQVRVELRAAGDALAERLASVRGDAWQRPGRRGDGAVFTVESFARYLLHDPVHHLHDIGARP